MNNKIITITALIVVIIGLVFYWFEWRPNNIRSACANDSSHYEAIGGWTPSEAQASYENCIHGRGLAN